MALSLLVNGTDRIAYLQDRSLHARQMSSGTSSLDCTLIDPPAAPSLGQTVQLKDGATTLWSGTISAIQTDDFLTKGQWVAITAQNTDTASIVAAPFGLSDDPDGSTTFGYQSLSVSETAEDSGNKTRVTLVMFEPGLSAGMTVPVTNALHSWSAQDFALSQIETTWDKDGSPRYTLTLGDVRVPLSTWVQDTAQGIADAEFPIDSTKISDSAVTTPKLNANAVTAAKIDSGAVTTGKLDAGAVTTAKLAAEAVTAGKLDVGGSPADNLFPDPLFEWAGYGDTSGWENIGDHFTIDTNGYGTSFKRGPHRLRMSTSAAATTQTRTTYIPVNGATSQAPYLTFCFEHGISYTSGTVICTWWAYDHSGTLLGNGTLKSWSAGVGWPTQEVFRFKPYGASNPADGTTIDVELPSGTAYMKFGWDDDGSATTIPNWFITYAGLFRGLVPHFSDGGPTTWDRSYSSVAIASNGILIRNGRLVVSNPSATVVIDGTSNMFKIAATGTVSKTLADGATGSATTTLTGLGALSTTPAHLSYLSTGNATASHQNVGHILWSDIGPRTVYVASTSGGSPTGRAIGLDGYCEVFTSLDGSSQAVVTVNGYNMNDGGSSVTYYARYYVLKEAAL